MEAKNAFKGSGGSSPSLAICSNDYAPRSKALSKAEAQNLFIPPFERKKSYLQQQTQGFSKAQSLSLRDQRVVVVINNDCEASSSESLSTRVIEQNPEQGAIAFSRQAYDYYINEDWSLAEFESMIENDACVTGVTWPGELTTGSLSLPNTSDTNVAQQTHLELINYLHAYDYLVKDENRNAPVVKIAVIDTGVDCNHSDLTENLVSGCGYNAISPLAQPTDNDGHGSHTAGIIGAGSNNGRGIMGLVGNNVQILPIKVIDVDRGSVTDAYNGIQYAINNGADVINISLQSVQQLPTIEQAITEAVQQGIVVVMAAGNQGRQLMGDVIVSPASAGRGLHGAITVGSIDSATRGLSYFSNYGAYVEIAAPGAVDSNLANNTGGIYSTYRNGGYVRMQGTSQSAPIVAAAAAMLIQFFKKQGVIYNPALIEQMLKDSTDTYGGLNVDGNRVLNFSKLTRIAHARAGTNLCSQ